VGSLPVPESASAFRQVPDVALSAASGTPGYVIVCTLTSNGQNCASTGGSPFGIAIGGTSASSPSFTGVVAILNQALGERLGNINPLLYSLGGPASAPPFHDITQGSNEIVCGTAAEGDAGSPGTGGWPDAGCGPNGLYGYPATTGYDCASGLGSIDAYNLVSALIGSTRTTTALAVSPTVTTEGTPVTLTATVEDATANPLVPSGSVTFTFESFTMTGATDLSWELGSVSLKPGANAATATLTTAIPPGMVKPTDQYVDIVAVYGGDGSHLSSTSAKVGLGFEKLTFAIDPVTLMLAPSGSHTFTTTGGTPPVSWYIDQDTTRGHGGGASVSDGGVLVVGAKPGYVEIAALDNYGAEALAYITVGAPDAGAPWAPDAGPFIDAGVPPLGDAAAKDAERDAAKDGTTKDSSVAPSLDGGAPDAAKTRDAEVDAGPLEVSSGGCKCDVLGARSEGGAGTAGLGGFALGLAVLARRRRRG
jgi:hypothetical protein